MRKFLLLILLSSPFVLFAQERKVTLNLTKQPIHSLFKQIQLQSGYNMVYSDEVISDTMLVSLIVHKLSVAKVLDSVLPSKGLFHHMLSENMIVIGSNSLKEQENVITKTLFSGTVINADELPVPFATVSLLEDELLASGAIANEQGNYRFSHVVKTNKTYQLKISSLGYEVRTLKFNLTTTNLQHKEFGRLKLQPTARVLKEVNVTASQKIVEMDGGNIVFNVSKSISAQGMNALDLLGRAPGVTVGSDNGISLNGKAGTAILIDGKQTYLSGREIAELLKSTSSSAIRSLEIINSPSAKYDAAGTAGIINLKTLKSLVQGFNASLTTGLSYGVYLRSNQDLSLSYRKDRLTLYGNYSHFLGYYSYLYGADRVQENKFYNSFTDDIDKRKKWARGLVPILR